MKYKFVGYHKDDGIDRGGALSKSNAVTDCVDTAFPAQAAAETKWLAVLEFSGLGLILTFCTNSVTSLESLPRTPFRRSVPRHDP